MDDLINLSPIGGLPPQVTKVREALARVLGE
jgi:hypothetical protein